MFKQSCDTFHQVTPARKAGLSKGLLTAIVPQECLIKALFPKGGTLRFPGYICVMATSLLISCCE